LKFVVNILKVYRDKSEYNLPKAIEELFSLIRIEVEEELNPILSQYNNEINPFFDSDVLSKIVNQIVKIDERYTISIINILSSLYIYLLIKNLRHTFFTRQIFMVERIMATHLADFKHINRNEFLINYLPDALCDKNPKSKIRNSIHIIFTNYINDLEEDVSLLSIKLKNSQDKLADLSIKTNTLTKQLNEKENNVNELTEQLDSKYIEINQVQLELQETINLLQYERNKYETQLQNLRTGLINRLHNNLRIELEGLSEISNVIPNNNGDIIRMYITNIHQIINGL
jgi:hypothetical protein